MISTYVGLKKQKNKVVHKERIQLFHVWYGTPIFIVLLFWNTNMAAVTSCENAL